VTDQLKTLDTRLSKLEELVLKHQDTLRVLAKAYEKDHPPKTKTMPDAAKDPEMLPRPQPANTTETPNKGKDADKPTNPDKMGEPKTESPDTMGTSAPELLHHPTPVDK
jgi:hypothetical protein